MLENCGCDLLFKIQVTPPPPPIDHMSVVPSLLEDANFNILGK